MINRRLTLALCLSVSANSALAQAPSSPLAGNAFETTQTNAVIITNTVTAATVNNAVDVALVNLPPRLQACPSSPNCVSSDSDSEQHQIAAIEPRESLEKSWAAIKAYIQRTPRFALIEQQEHYLKAEATTLIMRFTDDVEFEMRPQQNIIAVRSTSRVGHSDFGVNRKRIEAIRTHLQEQGL